MWKLLNQISISTSGKQLNAVLHALCIQLQNICYIVSLCAKTPVCIFLFKSNKWTAAACGTAFCVHANNNYYHRFIHVRKPSMYIFTNYNNLIEACSCMRYCMQRACKCKTHTTIVFSMCENPRVHIFIQIQHMNCRCMQYCMQRACNCKINTAIILSMFENPRFHIFTQLQHLNCSCMQYCMQRACNCTGLGYMVHMI